MAGNDRIRDPKMKMMSRMKSMTCLEPILARDFALTYLVNLSTMTSKWVKPPGAFLKGPKSPDPYGERPGDGDCLELLGRGVDLSNKVLASPAGSHYLHCIASYGRPVKALLESLPDLAS
jgi:hypothetical protein